MKVLIDPDAGGNVFGITREMFRKITAHDKQPMIGTFFNLEPADYDRLKSLSTELKVPVSQLCREAVKDFLTVLDGLGEQV